MLPKYVFHTITPSPINSVRRLPLIMYSGHYIFPVNSCGKIFYSNDSNIIDYEKIYKKTPHLHM